MQPSEILIRLSIALGVGLLTGVQREWKKGLAEVAGVRTFALIGMLGGVTALLGPWAIAAGLIGVIALFVIENLGRFQKKDFDPGMTTEFAGLVVFAIGAMAMSGYEVTSVVAGAVVALLLYLKPQLHGFVHKLGERDVRSFIQLVVIGLIILPVLPDRTYGPFGVLNPYQIWLMVVLIVSISLAAYAAHRVLGDRVGAVMGGVLGGFISSTATTVSYARRVAQAPEAASLAALVILIASTVVNLRILVEIGVVAPGFLPQAAPPIGILFGGMILFSLLALWRAGGQQGAVPLDHDNPSQLRAALVFAAMYAVIIFVVAAVKHYFGEQALYVLAVVSGLTDVDAITLSTAELVTAGRVTPETGWRVIVVAVMANLTLKGGAAAVLGGRRLGLHLAGWFGASLVLAGMLLALWP